MNARNTEGPVQARAKQLRFDRYVLNLERGCLLVDGNEIDLRPKTFAVLHYLVENCGRLVSKEELFVAVWPNVAVTDDALVQSIGELRRAIGDDGPRLIKTLPRRGYRFESEVSAVNSTNQLSADAATASGSSHDLARSPESVNVAARLLTFFSTPHAGWGIGLFASFVLALLLAAGVLWSSVESEWTFSNLAGRHVDRLANKGPEIGAKPAIAILPFLNKSDDSSREYFTDGLTQDIISALGRFSELTVMSWNAVFPYKGNPTSPNEIARNLMVRYQVEGSVLQIGDRVRVDAQLVNSDGRVLWSARFDEALTELFALQDKITTQIAGALAVRVAQVEQRRVFEKPTGSFEAYDYVLRARPALQRPARGSIVEARVLLRSAIELDPKYAAAYAALAETYYTATAMGWAESPTAYLSRAEEMALKALSLDDSEVRAHITLGRIHIFYQRYEQAKGEIELAIAINPNDGHAIAGLGNILMWSGQTNAAIEALELAQRIDPELNAMDRFALSLAYYLMGRYEAAIEQAELNLRKTPGAEFSRILLAAAYAEDNRTEDASRVVTLVRRIDPTFDPQVFGTKFLNSGDLGHIRDGLRKAGLFDAEAGRGRATDR